MDFKSIEKKWQEKWENEDIFSVLDDPDREKYYLLEMFPYPSGEGLHMGHSLNYTIGDIQARYRRMLGKNVLYPMGYDALGLPAENAAIKVGTHPQEYTNNSIKNFINQQKLLGLSYDWSRLINTSSPDYYKWDQWIFLKMLEKGLAYKKKAFVNWCPKCKTVLANEQSQGGICERCKSSLEIKALEQWFLKITDYAEELLDKIDELDWPKRTKLMQKNWIGKSYGVEINFKINDSPWKIFTTRPDTLFGVTFMVVSTQHPNLMNLVTKEQKKPVDDFLKKLNSVSEKELEHMEKEGVFTGSYATNPFTGEEIPIYAGNFVVADYGSGMVMAVPAHDKRDFAFAKKYGIDIKQVIDPTDFEWDGSEAYTGEGKLVNSGNFNGLDNETAKEEIVKKLIKEKKGNKKIQFKLRDWLISRQRYWGTPIPIVNCEKCGSVPVPEKNLPVVLPKKVEFGEGNPLESNEEWIRVKCPKCGREARRETDTMDTFVNSSWYFLRYCDPDNPEEIFDKRKVKYWMPIDQYIGGAEHACMHLIYCRFYTKFLRDLGLVYFDEPAKKLFHQGMLHGSDGEKMSKSRGNVINPLDTIEKFGADSLRLALMSFASPDSPTNWDEKVLIGNHKFLQKVFGYFEDVKIGEADSKIESKLNKIIKEVTNKIENFKYNLAIIKVRELFNSLPKETSKEVLEKSLKLLHPFCPHITEELYSKLKTSVLSSEGEPGKEIEWADFISLARWPEVEEKKISDFFEKQDQANDKLVSDIINILKIMESKGEKKEKVYIYVIPGQEDFYSKEYLSKKIDKKIEIFAVNDPKKYDPNNVSKKSKPGKPGIYLE